MITFAAIVPHPPIILPSVGSPEDRQKVDETIKALKELAKKLKEIQPEKIVIISPHPDWGFEVPQYFLTKDFQGEIEKILTGSETTADHFEKGKEFFKTKIAKSTKRIALIISGDLSHRLKEDGPYGFHPDGPKFDREIIDSLKKKDVQRILNLEKIYPEAGECGLRPICFLLGILEAWGKNYSPKILAYQNPWGVGYLSVEIEITS